MNFNKKLFYKSLVVMFIGCVSGIAYGNDEIVSLAKEEAKEGRFMIMVSSPKSEQAHRKIMKAFQNRFDIKVDWEWTPLTSTVSAPRVVQQAQAGLPVPSAIGGYSYNTYENWFVKNNLDTKVNWVQEFHETFPSIKQIAHDGVLDEYRDRMLRQWDVQYVMVYNTSLVKPENLPKSLLELAEPKWKGQFAMANNTPPPLDIMALDLGVDAVVQLTKDLIANKPRFKAGPPAVVGAISSGEVAVGLSGYTALAEAQKQKGAPIDWIPLQKIPVGPLFMFMLKDAPQPNLGKLFLAWLATEGSELMESEEFMSLIANEDSPTTKRIKELQPDFEVIEVKTKEELQKTEEAARQIMQAVADVAGV